MVAIEEAQILTDKIAQYRNILAEGVLKVAEKMDAANKPAKMDKLINSFRVGWREWKNTGNKKATLDRFMWNMDCEL